MTIKLKPNKSNKNRYLTKRKKTLKFVFMNKSFFFSEKCLRFITFIYSIFDFHLSMLRHGSLENDDVELNFKFVDLNARDEDDE